MDKVQDFLEIVKDLLEILSLVLVLARKKNQ